MANCKTCGETTRDMMRYCDGCIAASEEKVLELIDKEAEQRHMEDKQLEHMLYSNYRRGADERAAKKAKTDKRIVQGLFAIGLLVMGYAFATIVF